MKASEVLKFKSFPLFCSHFFGIFAEFFLSFFHKNMKKIVKNSLIGFGFKNKGS